MERYARSFKKRSIDLHVLLEHQLVFPFAGPKAASKNIAMKALRGVGRFLPLGPLPFALISAINGLGQIQI